MTLTTSSNNNPDNIIKTTFYREIVFNIEHTIHHLALIHVALREIELDLVGEDFGMAYSTIRYKASLINETYDKIK